MAGVRMIAHDKYRLGDRLGRGGMADVFRAEITGAEGFSRPVAIKRLHAAVSSDPEFCAMFVQEARLLASLQHPNIVSVLDFEWDAEARLFLVMEIVDGVNLAELIRTGPLPVPAAVHVTAEVLRGLGHAHARGILHRDVTPHNVLLSWNGEIKLSDFGLAKATAGSRISDRNSVRGKVPYLSPEQLQGLDIDARSDLFSVGVMSYELLTARYPFFGRGDHPTMAESIARMLTASIVPPAEVRPEIPRELSDVVMRLLARDREQRYASAGQVLAALPPSLDGQQVMTALLVERFPGAATREPEEESPTSAAIRRAQLAGRAHAGQPQTDQPQADHPETDQPQAGHPETDQPQTGHPETDQPAHLRDTVSVHTGQEREPGRTPRWRRAALLLLLVPLLWLAAPWWPTRDTDLGEPTATVDYGDRSTRMRDVDTAAMTGTAQLTHVDAGVAPAESRRERPVMAPATVRAHSPAPAGPRAQRGQVRHVPGQVSLSLPPAPPAPGATSGPPASPAGGPVAGTEVSKPPLPPAGTATTPGTGQSSPAPARPRLPPAGPRYEGGWTERGPQDEITGEIPIRRTERR
jgi:serine/threonine protein kinase